ncbi:unnamed protein product [Protopolystoma xenopodis]|uniref:Uncharacterized protein n=1 Tax=Protopolystoma xenopodis TaxID=117903 RepID=A0A448WD08_9PLAT|nr:unnamed protein product [Protopolystoma xenopodis]
MAPLFADTLSASEPKKALPSFPNLFAPARSEAPLFNASTFNGLAPSGTSATSVASCTSITFANAAPSTATTATNGLGALVSSPIFGCGSLTASYNPSLSLTTTTTTVASNATSGSLQSTSGPGNLFSFGQQQQTNLFGSPQSGAFTTAFSSHGSQGLSGLFQSAGITPDATAAVSVGSPFSTTNLGMINSPLASTTSTNAVTTGSNAIQLPSGLSVFGSAPSIATSLSTVVSTAPSLFSSPKVGSNTPVSTVSAMSSPLSALTVAQAPALNIGLFRFGLQPATSTTTTTPSPLFTSPGPNGAAGATLTGIAPSLISPGSSSGLFKFGAQSQTLNSSPGNVPFMFGQAAPGFSLQPNIASVGPNATLTSTPPASNPFLLGCTTTRPGDSSLPGSAGIASTAQARRRTAAGARRTKRS